MNNSLRTCVISNKIYPKSELVRLAIINKTEIKIDWDQKLLGRGLYIKNTKDNLDKIIQRHGNLRYRQYQYKLNDIQIEELKAKAE